MHSPGIHGSGGAFPRSGWLLPGDLEESGGWDGKETLNAIGKWKERETERGRERDREKERERDPSYRVGGPPPASSAPPGYHGPPDREYQLEEMGKRQYHIQLTSKSQHQCCHGLSSHHQHMHPIHQVTTATIILPDPAITITTMFGSRLSPQRPASEIRCYMLYINI